MKSHITLLTLAAFALTAAPLAADHHEFKPIFDGKTLDGWKSSTDNPAAFSVDKDGTLKVTGERAHLFYVGPYGNAAFSNFELKLKAKTMPSANSGVYFHTRYQDTGWPTVGYEAQVNSTQSDPKKTGGLYGVVDLWLDKEAFKGGQTAPFVTVDDKGGVRMIVKEAPSKDNEWFDYHIIVEGKKITLKINGQTTVEFTEPKDWAGPNPATAGRKLSKGTIALQAHDPGSTVFYKDIMLKITDK
jgi:hypothetical protein